MIDSPDNPPAPAPAFAVPPHVVDDSGSLVGWFVEPAGMLLQFAHEARGTTRMVEWMVGPVFERLIRRFPAQRGLRVVLDMRNMTGRAATARALLIANATRVLPRVGRVVLVPSRHMGSDYVRVVEVSARLVTAMGLPVDIEDTLEHALAKHAFRLAPARAPQDDARAPAAWPALSR